MLIISLTVHNLLNVDNLTLYSFESETQMTLGGVTVDC